MKLKIREHQLKFGKKGLLLKSQKVIFYNIFFDIFLYYFNAYINQLYRDIPS